MIHETPCAQTLSKISHQLELILTHAGEGIFGLDVTGKTIFVNQAAAAMTGLSLDQMQKSSNHELVHHHRPDGSEYPKEDCPVFATLTDGIPRKGEDEFFIRADGSFFPIEYFANPIIENGEITGVVVTFIDITERIKTQQMLLDYQTNLEQLVEQKTQDLQAANQQLLTMSLVDGLTNIANRRAFDQTLFDELRRAARKKETMTLMIADIDFFKQFNDTYGHCAGDDCLKEIALAIQSNFKRSGDFVARYGGEEFAMILPSMTLTKSEVIAAKLITKIEQLNISHKASACSGFVTLSLGLVNIVPTVSHTPEALIKLADKALYLAKNSGKNQFKVHRD